MSSSQVAFLPFISLIFLSILFQIFSHLHLPFLYFHVDVLWAVFLSQSSSMQSFQILTICCRFITKRTSRVFTYLKKCIVLNYTYTVAYCFSGGHRSPCPFASATEHVAKHPYAPTEYVTQLINIIYVLHTHQIASTLYCVSTK